MLNSDLSPATPQGGREPPTDKTRVVSTRRLVPTNCVSGRTLQPSIESVVTSSFVPSDFLVDGQVSGLGTVHPLLTLNFFSTWIIPLHVVSSTLKRKSSSSVMDGLQRRRRRVPEGLRLFLLLQWYLCLRPQFVPTKCSKTDLIKYRITYSHEKKRKSK